MHMICTCSSCGLLSILPSAPNLELVDALCQDLQQQYINYEEPHVHPLHDPIYTSEYARYLNVAHVDMGPKTISRSTTESELLDTINPSQSASEPKPETLHLLARTGAFPVDLKQKATLGRHTCTAQSKPGNIVLQTDSPTGSSFHFPVIGLWEGPHSVPV